MYWQGVKNEVCSPGGSTIQGVRLLEQRGVRAAMMDAVIAACAAGHSGPHIHEGFLDGIELPALGQDGQAGTASCPTGIRRGSKP